MVHLLDDTGLELTTGENMNPPSTWKTLPSEFWRLKASHDIGLSKKKPPWKYIMQYWECYGVYTSRFISCIWIREKVSGESW